MSWHCLPEQAGGFSVDRYVDSIRSRRARSKNTRAASYSLGNVTGCSQLSLFGTTYERSTGDHGAASWMLSPAAFHAKTSAQRVAVSELPDPVRAYGLKCSELLERFGLRLFSRKTARTFAPVGLASSSKVLPAWGMTFAGVCWGLGTRAHRIDATECGSMLPTPTANMYGSNKGGSGGRVGRERPNLGTLIERSAESGKLNPPWVAWLMGWPIGWTDCARLEMDRYQQWRRLHGRYCTGLINE